MPQGWQLVYMVVRAAMSGPSSRAAQRASFSSGWAVMSLSRRTVLWASIKTSPRGPASSEPYGSSPVVTAVVAMPIARRRNVRSSGVIMTMSPFARPPRQWPPGAPRTACSRPDPVAGEIGADPAMYETHPHQPQRVRHLDGVAGRGQPGVLSADVPDLNPDHHRVPGRSGRMPGDLEQSRAEEEHHPGIVGRAELPVDGQAQYVAVEVVAAVQVAGPQEYPAAQNVHATSSTAR